MSQGGSIEGLRAVVTGGARGIGAAIVDRLGRDGARVATIDIDDPVETSAAFHAVADLTHDTEVSEAFSSVRNQLGGVDILVNNAGAFTSVDPLALDLSALRSALALGVVAPLVLAGLAAKDMIRRGKGGRIVNITSVQGSYAAEGGLGYEVGKAALNQATRTLAVELAPHSILVNAVAPGFVRTRLSDETEGFRTVFVEHGLLPLRRRGEPEEIAGLVAWLVGPDSSYVTGQTMSVDGGLSSTLFPVASPRNQVS